MENLLGPIILLEELEEIQRNHYDEDGNESMHEESAPAPIHSSSVSIATAQTEESEEACNLVRGSRKKNKKPKPEEWERNVMKRNREHGNEYKVKKKITNENGKVETEKMIKCSRKMGDSCSSGYCIKNKSCHLFSEETRLNVFNTFWKNMNWQQKKILVISLIDLHEPKSRRKDSNFSRENKISYHLKLLNERHEVCRNMFLSTFGLKRGQVQSWLKMEKNLSVSPPATTTTSSNVAMTTTDSATMTTTTITSAPTTMATDSIESASTSISTTAEINNNNMLSNKKENERRKFLLEFFSRLPKTPSHYCRQNSTKIYLEPTVQTQEKLREVYNEECLLKNVKPLSRPVFNRVFSELNLSIFIPRKDQCDICEGKRIGTICEKDEKFLDHLKKKTESRVQKNLDKLLAQQGKCYVLTMDLEQVKLCPTLFASKSYFKTKLACHNYTIYNLHTGHTSCYWWTEVDAECVASSFASCLIDYLKNTCLHPALPIVIFSDGCGYQNRNAMLSSALLAFSIDNKVQITQKFLEKGHTWMEVDSVHSSIESKLKNRNIYTPSQFADASKECRPKNPYDVKLLSHDFFSDYSDKSTMKYSTIRPGQKSGDNVVTDIRVLNYSPDGKISYKLNYSDEFQDVPNSSRTSTQALTFPKLYDEPLKITDRKYKDLQELKEVIPPEHHGFYDALPHGKQKKKKTTES